MMVDFQTYAGPGDKALPNTEIEGYQPVSRIGEIVMNAFVDAGYEYTSEAMHQIKLGDLNLLVVAGGVAGRRLQLRSSTSRTFTSGPPCARAWSALRAASAPRSSGKYVAAETAVPVIAWALRAQDGVGEGLLFRRRRSYQVAARTRRRTMASGRPWTSSSRCPSAAWSPCSTTPRPAHPPGRPHRMVPLEREGHAQRQAPGSRARAALASTSPSVSSRKSSAAPSALPRMARASTSSSSSRRTRVVWEREGREGDLKLISGCVPPDSKLHT